MLEDPFGYTEEQQQRCYWRRVGFGLFFAMVLVLILVPLLAGCASTEEPKICYMQVLGRTEEGYTVVAQQCMTQEQFKEIQSK